MNPNDYTYSCMLDVCVYKDDTGLYTEEECERDNLVDLLFPAEILKSWYRLYKNDFDAETMSDLKIPEEECDFNKWYSYVCTADDFDGLCDYARRAGFEPERPDGPKLCPFSHGGYCDLCPDENKCDGSIAEQNECAYRPDYEED